MVQGLDVASTFGLSSNDLIVSQVALHLYTDTNHLYDSLTNINNTTERLLVVNLRMLRKS